MGIVLASNFDVKTNLALDSRTNKNTIEERNAIPTEVRFEGLECYVKEDGGLYRLTGGVENGNWSLIPYTDADGNLTIDGNLILNNSSTPINIKEYIDTLTAAGIHYIGTLDGTESSPGSFTPAAEVGDMYIVSTAGYINGVEVEVGDSILCHTDTEAANSGTYTSINSNWNYVQTNISTMRGATSDTPGMSGIVPIPSAGSENKYLKGDGTWSSIAQSDVTDLVSDLESKADKQNSYGGFAAGNGASATVGGAVGAGASADYSGFAGGASAYTTSGGAVGQSASTTAGGAVGASASATIGGAVGASASTTAGGAVGASATSGNGGAVGTGATSGNGGAVGAGAKTGNGFAGGLNAQAVDAENNGIDAIQLGSGTNSTEKTLQVYDYQLMDADGNIPSERLKTSNGGFAAGNGASATVGGAVGYTASATTGGAVGAGASAGNGGAVGTNASATVGGAVGYTASATDGGAVGYSASATSGGAVGYTASATTGGAVGMYAKTSTGFAGGYNAKAVDGENNGIDAIQLGSGTNSTEKTLQVYDYQLMDADGNIPSERLKTSNGGFAAGNGASATVGGAVGSNAKETDGGFAAGNGASATSGGAIGSNASTTTGGAVGYNASAATTGGAVGYSASATYGGGAVGYSASATFGGAIGSNASADAGGAVGSGAKTSTGFAGGYNAKTQTSSSVAIDAIQLGTGTNSTAKTLQVYDYQLMDSTGNIPLDRIQSALDESGISGGQETAHTHANKDVLDGISSTDISNWNNKADKQNSDGGFVGGQYASANSGGAIGYAASSNTGGAVGIDASANQGGAVGDSAKTSDGFAGGYSAQTVDDENNGIDAIQLGTGTNSVAKTLQVYEYQLMDANGNIPSDRLKNLNGGFAAGYGASAITGGGAVGREASAAAGGGAVGGGASSTSGGAVGNGASATTGGAVGLTASSTSGGAVGNGASANTGGAVGNGAKTSDGFAGGYSAQTVDDENNGIDAIQLGTGTNSVAKTLQVYEYQLMDANGNIPSERLKTSNGGFAAGNGASATHGGAVGHSAYAVFGAAVGWNAFANSGGAVGNGAYVNQGGAVGDGAKTSHGFAGGYNAKAVDDENIGIDAIQLGTGTNSTAKTLQVYDYQLMTADGQIPEARMSSLSSAKHTHSNKSTLDGISSTNITSWNNKVDTSDLPNIKKNSSSTSGDIISSHITIGSRGSGTYGSRTLFVGTMGRASGQSSANIGYNNTSSGAYSLTVGQGNTGTGQASGTFGLNSSTGNYSLTSGTNNVIGGYSVGMGSAISSPSDQGYCFGFGYWLETSGNNTAIGHYNKAMTKSSSSGTSGDAFVIGNGTTSATSNAFRVTYSGSVYGKSTYHSTGADYAEYFEWEDGNPNAEDRRGLFVTWGNNGLVKLANEGDEILGVVSVTPSVVGNAYEDDWQGMYQTDIFGQPLSHIVHHDAEYVDIEMPDVDDEGNELETTHIEHQLLHEAYDAEEYILNPEYDSEQEYIPRSDRKEWAAVGLMGQLIVIDDGSCTVNGYCTVGSNGTATTSDTGFKVLKRLDDTHIKVFIK